MKISRFISVAVALLACLPSFAAMPSDTLSVSDGVRLSETSVEGMISGRFAGVEVVFSDDAPGRIADVRIRGVSSSAIGGSPLYVIDGFRVDADHVRFLSLSQIEKIEVLKDMGAVALYGADGANGVILITTRNGEYGKVKVELDARLGGNLFSKASLGDAPYCKDALGTSMVQDYNLSVSGGSETAGNRFFSNFSVLNDDGVLTGSGFRHIQGNMRYEQNFGKRVKMHIGAAYRHTKLNGIDTRTPYADYKVAEDGTLSDNSSSADAYIMYYVLGHGVDPMGTLKNATAYSSDSNITAELGLNANLAKGLDLSVSGFYGIRNYDEQHFNNSATLFGAKDSGFGMGVNASVYATQLNRYSAEALLSYKVNLGKVAALKANAGFLTRGEYGTMRGERSYAMTTEALGTSGLNTGKFIPVDIWKSRWNQLETHANLSVIFKKCYEVYASLAADGYKGSGDRSWTVMPSVGAAWIFSDEEFMPQVISSGRLDASWGKAGYTAPYVDSDNNTLIARDILSGFDVTFSIGLLKDRISAQVAYFLKANDSQAGAGGVEIGISGYPVKSGKVSWMISANSAFYTFKDNQKAVFGGASTSLRLYDFDFQANFNWNPAYSRFSNVTLGYTIPVKVFGFKVFVSASNLIHSDLFKGLDLANELITAYPGKYSLSGGLSFKF